MQSDKFLLQLATKKTTNSELRRHKCSSPKSDPLYIEWMQTRLQRYSWILSYLISQAYTQVPPKNYHLI